MLRRSNSLVRDSRLGAAAVELAILLPLLGFLFVAGVDFARVFYHFLTITNCARNGAVYASYDSDQAVDTAGIQAAALQDASSLSPTPSVASANGVDASGNPYVQVTVTYPFQTFASYPGIPRSITVTRTVQMRVAPRVPSNS